MRDETLGGRYEARLPLLQLLATDLEVMTRTALADVSHIDRIAFRAKDLISFEKKAQQDKYSNPLEELEDQVAGRVITFFKDDITIVRDELTNWFGPVEHQIKEPAGPAEFGYESDHFVFVIPEHHKPDGWSEEAGMPSTFELQIRTLFMHAWAEPQHDLGYKGNPLDLDTQRELVWIAASAWGADRTLNGIARKLKAGTSPVE